MYLNVGSDILVRIKDIIGIFDMDNTTVSRLGREFLPKAQRDGAVIDAAEDLPKSYVVAKSGIGVRVYFSSLSSQVLSRRAKTSIL